MFVLFAGLAIGNVVTTARARTRNRAAAKAACAGSPEARQPMFVMVVARGEAESALAVRALVTAFERATCPLRVYAGVAEYVGGNSAGVSDADAAAGSVAGPAVSQIPITIQPFVRRFDTAAKAAAVPFAVADHVRVLRAPLGEFQGYGAAREQVQRFLYRAEPYVVCLGVHVLLDKHWDTILQAAIHSVGPRSVVSAQPARLPSNTFAMFQKAASGTSGGSAGAAVANTAATMGTFLTVARCGGSTLLGTADTNPTGIQLAAYAMHVPAGKDALAILPSTVRALAWTPELSISRGPLPLAGAGELVPSAVGAAERSTVTEAVTTTARLIDLQWTMYHFTGRVASATAPAAVTSAAKAPTKLLPNVGLGGTSAAVTIPISAAAARYLGVNLGAGVVENRARLGLVPGPNAKEEVAVKVGSVGDVLSTLSRLELQNAAANKADTTRRNPQYR